MKFCIVILFVLCEYDCSPEFQTQDAKLLKGNFDTQVFGELSVNNDNWGTNAGPQNLTVYSGSNWCAKCSHGSSGGIKSYPHTSRKVNKPLNSLTKITSTFAGKVDVIGSGTLAYSFSYDIWCQNNKIETMLWMFKTGEVGAIGTLVCPKQKLGDYTWDVYKGTNGANDVISFINLSPTMNGMVDIKALLEFEVQKGWVSDGPAVLVDDIQFGYEITSTPPESSFCVTAFSVDLN